MASCMRRSNRLFKNAHLLRCAHPSSLRRTVEVRLIPQRFRAPCICAFLISLGKTTFSTNCNNHNQQVPAMTQPERLLSTIIFICVRSHHNPEWMREA